MSLNQLHGPWALQVGVTTPFTIPGIQSLAVPSNTQVSGEITDGQLEREFQSIVSQSPIMSLATLAVGTALTKFSTQFYTVNATAQPTGINAFARKHVLGASRDAGAVHRRYRMTAGMIVPRVLTCDHQGDASLTFDALAIYDGTNAPIIITDSVSIPTTLLTGFDERYTLGPVKINNVLITSVKSVSIDFGVNAVLESAGGDIWPTWGNARTIEPVVTINGMDVDWMKDTADAGGAVKTLGEAILQGQPTQIYFRKRKDSTTFELDVTAVHPHFVFNGMAYGDPFITQSGSDPSEVNLKRRKKHEG